MNSRTIRPLALSLATLASVNQIALAQSDPSIPSAATSADLAALRQELAELREEVRRLKAEKPAGTSTSTSPLDSKTTPEPPAKAASQVTDANAGTKPSTPPKWYDSINLRGYAQVRYNRLLETNRDLRNEQGDRSIGNNNGLFLRRMRLIFSGQVNKRVYFYVQPDFASSTSSTQLNYGQIRDAYFDVGLDDKNQYRFRIGQSKIPYGFENMQSSQNRLPLDRADSLNSAFTNERDIGLMFYYAPDKIRKRFADLVSSGLKGSGDYGVVGLGVFNGQTANRPELNNRQHVVGRLTYPFAVGKQIIEPSIQAYKGKYVVPSDQITTGTLFNSNRNYADERVAATFVLYPKPFGIQAEYNWGKGPEFNPATDTIETQRLQGGYVTFSYLTKIKKNVIIPFTRFQNYNGGKKHELDARSYNVREMEFGIEWQPSKNFELTTQYTISNRRFEDFVRQNNRERGGLLRLQAQLNF